MNSSRRIVALVAAGLAAVLLLPAQASAHTGFESSEPADGSVARTEVGSIVVHFSGAADPAGDGFVVVDGSGTPLAPSVIATNPERTSWTLGFDPPLSSGIVGVRWTVQAPDAHPISGSFSFTVDPPAPAETVDTGGPTSGQEPVDTDGAATEQEPVDTRGAASQASQQEAPASTDRPTETTAPTDERSEPSEETVAAPAAPTRDLEAFLDAAPSTVPKAGAVGAIGRLLGFLGTMFAIGGVAFATYVIRDRRSDVLVVLVAVGRAGLVVIAGTGIDIVAQLAVANGGWESFWSPRAVDAIVLSHYGVAVGLRMGAGFLVYVAADLMMRAVPLYVETERPVALPAAVGGGVAGADAPPDRPRLDVAERSEGASLSPTMLAAIVVLLASFTFDGHTVTEGDRWVTAVVDMVHVVAASIWAGGVVAFTLVLWRRHRRAQRSNALELALRFSVIAGAALALAGLAGSVLAAIILDSVSQLWSTSWGRLLVAKFLVVGGAALVGTYNHFVVIPWLRGNPGDGVGSAKLRKTVTFEAVLLVAVLTITAFLVEAASR